MKIARLTLQTSKLKDMLSFYHELLQMPLLESSDHSFAVAVGNTILAFEQMEEKPFYHFALGMAEAAFDHFADVIKDQVTVLVGKAGEAVTRSYTWKGKQLYFEDPDRNIVEILSFPSEEAAPWLSVQEIGMPVPDIAHFARGLTPVETEFSPESDSFCFYGDQEGVFVLVKERRPWYPTDRAATVHPIRVEVVNPCEFICEWKNDQLPYQVSSESDLP